VLGPVQLLAFSLVGPQLPTEILQRIKELNDGPAVDIIDALILHKNQRGELQSEPVADLRLKNSHEPGSMILKLMDKATVAKQMGHDGLGGTLDLFRGGPWPDPRASLVSGSTGLGLLVEHQWARGLRETGVKLGGAVIANGWVGRGALRELGLPAQDGA
jgi:hypothetical protein